MIHLNKTSIPIKPDNTEKAILHTIISTMKKYMYLLKKVAGETTIKTIAKCSQICPSLDGEKISKWYYKLNL